MPYRSPIPDYSNSEQGTSTAIKLGAGVVSTQGLVPKSANGQSIVGLVVTLNASVQQSAAQAWNVGQLFAGMKISKGSSERLKIRGYRQLQGIYNSLTRLDDSAIRYFSNPSNTGTAGTSTQTMSFHLPLHLRTDVTPVVVFSFNPFSAVGATGGTVTSQIQYLYGGNTVEDDYIHIITTPSSLSSGVAIDVSQYFSYTGQVSEVWMDITNDANLAEQTFRFGSTPVYDKHNAWQLRADTNPSIFSLTLDGLLKCKTVPVAYPPNGVSGNKPILDMTFNNAVQPTFYLYSKIS